MGGCCETTGGGGGGCRPPRLPSVTCFILCSAAYATALLSGVTCTFLRVHNTPMDNAPIVSDVPSEFYESTFPPNYSLGVYCPPPHSSVEGVDTLWLTARIFLSVGLTLGLINLGLSLATCTPLMTPTKTNWKAMGVLSALAGSVQVPTFLMFDSSSCHHRGGGGGDEERYYTSSCQMDLGSFLLVCSVAIQLSITAFTQCVDAPDYDVEEERKLDAWRKNDGRDAKSWDMSSVTAPGSPMSRVSSEIINDVEIGRRQDEAMRRGGARGNFLTKWWIGFLGRRDAGRRHGGKERRPEEDDDGVNGGDGDATATSAAVGSVSAISGVRRGKKRKPTRRAKSGPPTPSRRHVRSTSDGSRSSTVEVLKRSATQLAEDDDVEALELDQVDEEDDHEDDDDDEISHMRRSGPYDEESGRNLLGIEASPLRGKAAAPTTMASERTLQTSNHGNNDKNDDMSGVRVGLVEQRRREVSARLLGTTGSTSTHDDVNGVGATGDEEARVGVERAPPKGAATTPQRRSSIKEKKRGDGGPNTAYSSSEAAAATAATLEGRPPPSPRKKASRPASAGEGHGGNGTTTTASSSPQVVRREMATTDNQIEMPPPPQKQSLSSRIASMFRGGGDRAYDVINDSGSSVVSSNPGSDASPSVVRNAAVAAAAANDAPRHEREILGGGSRRHVQMRLSETNKQTISMMDVVAVRQSSVADMSSSSVGGVGGGGSVVVTTPSYDDEDGGSSSCYTTASEGGPDPDGGDDEDAASEAPFDERGRPPSVGPTNRNVASIGASSPKRSAALDDDDGVSSVAGGGGAPSEIPFDELLDRARRGVALGLGGGGGTTRRASSVSASTTRGGGVGVGGGGSSPRSLTKRAWRNDNDGRRRGHSVAAPSHVVGAASTSLTTKKTPPRTPVNTDVVVQSRSPAATTPRSSSRGPQEPSTSIGHRDGNNVAARRRGRSVTPRTTEVSSSSSTPQRPGEEEQGREREVQQTGDVNRSSGTGTPRSRGRSVSALRSVWERNGEDQPSSAGGGAVVSPSTTNDDATPRPRRGSSVTPARASSRDGSENGPLLGGVTESTSRNAMIPPSPSRRGQTRSIARGTPEERRRSQSVAPSGSTRVAASGSGRTRGQSVNRNSHPTPPRSRSVAPPGSPWAGAGAKGGGQPTAASDGESAGVESLTPSRRGRSTTPRSRELASKTEGGGHRAPSSGPPPPSARVRGEARRESSEMTTGSIGKGRNDGEDEDEEDRPSAVGSYLDRLGRKKMDGGSHHQDNNDAKLETTQPRSTPPPPPTFEKTRNDTHHSEENVTRASSSAVVSPDIAPSSSATGSSNQDEISSPPRMNHHPPTPTTSSSFFRRTNPSPSPNHRYTSAKSYGGSAMSPRSGKVAGTTVEPSPKAISGDRARVVTPERSEPPTGEARAATPPRIAPSSSSRGAPPRYGSLVDARKQMFERKNHRSDDSSSEASSAVDLRNGSRSVSVSRRRPSQQQVSQSPQHRHHQAGGVAGRRGSSTTPQPRSEMDRVSIV